MDALDWALAPVYFFVFWFWGNQIAAANSSNPLYRAYYRTGLNYKFIGSIGYAFVYLFYYKGGDSLNFFYAIRPTFDLLIYEPAAFFEFIFSPNDPYPWQCMGPASRASVNYLLHGSASLTTIRVGAFLNVFCLNSYVALCLLFAFLSYQFQFKLFVLISRIYPKLHKQFSYALLLIPSVIFWGSALSKDTIMYSAIMVLFVSFYEIFIQKRNVLLNVAVIIITAYIMSLIRGFILFTMVPCLTLMLVTYYREAISSSALRFLIGPIMLAGGLAASVFFVQSLGETVQSYNLESLEQKAEGFRSWHTTQGGSTYSIGGDLEFTPMGILRQAPVAIVITLFGPFIWQIRSPFMLLSGIESALLLYLFVTKVFFNRRLFSLVGVLLRDHIVVFCLPFVLILATAIGLTSFNYGALVRYRIPVLPFFAVAFVLINHHLTTSKAVKPVKKRAAGK